MAFDDDAVRRWDWFYAEMAASTRFGLAGAVTARHEAQVARLSLIYALADEADAISEEHLEAAVAFADYARRSVTWALGDSTGNRHADVLLSMLSDGEVGWEEGKRALGLRTAAEMEEAVAVLLEAELAESFTVPRETGGSTETLHPGVPRKPRKRRYPPARGREMRSAGPSCGWLYAPRTKNDAPVVVLCDPPPSFRVVWWFAPRG